MNTFEEDLQEAISYHGDLCAGQILGVQMARLGCQLLEIDNPKENRDLIVYIECDRCLTDAIGTVTGCKLGKRTLKWKDYGKSAATFLNAKTGEAFRIYKKTKAKSPKKFDLVEFFNGISDKDMFDFEKVEVNYNESDLPGKPIASTTCIKCKEEITDMREVMMNGEPFCKSCSDESYYKAKE